MNNYEQLLALLMNAQKDRGKRNQWVKSPGSAHDELEWVIFERQTMLEGVNLLRLEKGLPAVSVEDVMQAENMACGHSDYTRKFALYCSELVAETK